MDKEKILLCLAKALDKDIEEIKKLPENALLKNNGLDSIKFITFIVEMENIFDFEVHDRDLLINNFETLEKTYETLRRYFDVSDRQERLNKCLILDCDGVLWKGIAGEEDIIIDGLAILFQNELVKLYQKGIFLCLCSKNDKENINKAFKNKNMILKHEHIAVIKTNSENKVKSIEEIASGLNLSTDSFVFADDDFYETGLVKSFMPEVETIRIDYNSIGETIKNIKRLFNTDNALQDLNRTKLYIEQKERVKLLALFDSVEEYNQSLETKIICDIAGIENTDRIAELSRRTNQFNLADRHYTIDDIKRFINDETYTVFYLSASDKYGDMGIIAAAVVKKSNPDCAVIENFMLSCRVFSRGFEYVMLDKIKETFRDTPLSGIFILTEKNKKHGNFYTENGVNLCMTK